MESKTINLEEDIVDQYADGKAARVWENFIGDKQLRTKHYKNFLVGLLREKGCRTILDVACGTGIDSVMLLEEGFKVTSIDASDKMLKYAFRTRWERRKEKAFDEWTILEANWLTLTEDLENVVGNGFDAVMCLGNSFPHLPDSTGDQRDIRTALQNFEKCVKPGGILMIDHRNFDQILDMGCTPSKSIYYNSENTSDIVTYVSYINGKPNSVALDYVIDLSRNHGGKSDKQYMQRSKNIISKFRLTYYPHRLEVFTDMLDNTFGPKCKHTIYGDFQLLEKVENPGFYVHVVEKANI